MEKFWAVILIFVVVAAAGLMYVNQVYIPQKDTQEEMANMAYRTLSAVRSEIGDDSITYEVMGNKIEEEIISYLEDNSIERITIGGNSFYDVDDIGDITGINTIIDKASLYYMRVTSNDGKVTRLSFTKKA
ncbi:MAG TPA: hypothetical protein PLG67_02445 [Bacillota bacterium]|nr:hypothetical protein [Bacillota bacterium]